jgi:hypothetical protein
VGYHVAILRSSGGEEVPIPREEADRLFGAHPDFRVVESDARRVVYQADGYWLEYLDGQIWTKNPEDAALVRMIALAAELGAGARVRGDELETYRTVDESYVHPDDAREVEEAARSRGAFRKRADLVKWGKVAVLLVVAASIVRRCMT